MNKGIAIAGNLIVDYVKVINTFPTPGMLASIESITRGIGGCAGNTIVDLSRLDGGVPLTCIGVVGDDENGRYILDVLNAGGINTSQVHVDKNIPTSFTDVMNVFDNSVDRTYFHARGANSVFSYEHIDFDAIEADIFHIGYALLLDALDAPDDDYGTVMARVLSTAREKGFKTSMDCVSEDGDRFARVVTPSLKYCDYVIINEVEAGRICEIPVRGGDGALLDGNIKKVMERLFEKGVKERVVLHAPEAGWHMDASGEMVRVNSLKLPEGYIKGTVGAGDAFCAGVIYSIYKGKTPELALRAGAAAAAANLSHENSVDGMRTYEGIMELDARFERR